MRASLLLASLALAVVACETKDPSTDPDADGDGYPASEDCDDSNFAIRPDVDELCDGVDNDCDGEIDEDDAINGSEFYVDGDGDGIGGEDTDRACALRDGLAEVNGDCNDGDAQIYPDADERCNDTDDDCDGEVDEDNPIGGTVYYADEDGDGYGDPDNTIVSCLQPEGYLTDSSDCDDTTTLRSPSADERCNGGDDDCDGAVDEEDAIDPSVWYQDADGDGVGVEDVTTLACAQPPGYSAEAGDCDDSDSELTFCDCELTGVGRGTDVVSAGSVYGTWLVDPLETLGAGKMWELDFYTGSTLVEYASESALASRVSTSTTTLPSSFDGTGAVIYDGVLYYNKTNSNVLVQYDIAKKKVLAELTLTGAGYRNTYYYQWGGYSDIDFAVDEIGLWVIYATSANSGRLVVSQLDPATFTILATYNTTSSPKTSIGNAFMACGILYATSSYSSSSATINFAYNTADGTTWNPGIAFGSAHGYTAMIDYDPNTQTLYTWDYYYRTRFPATITY